MQQKNDITYIGVPFRSGANREGAQYAPQWLMENLSLHDKSSICMMQFPDELIPLDDSSIYGIKNYAAVLQMKKKVKELVAKTISDSKKIVVVGGDHSISMGSIAGLLECEQNLGVIWFDAHTDINTETSSPSGNAHGMPLAALMGLCNSEINNNGKRLKPANVFWIGARDIDEGEREIIHSLGVDGQIFTSDQVRHEGMVCVMDKIRTMMREHGIKHLHLSFDIDGMDSSIIPATGTPVPNGLTNKDCDEFLTEISQDMPSIIALDFVEYNPLLDNENYSTGIWCVNTLNKLIAIIR